MKLEKITLRIISAIFLAVIFILGVSNFQVAVDSIKKAVSEYQDLDGLQKRLSAVETTMKNDFSQKDLAADIYGISLTAMNKGIVGDHEYYKNENGQVVRFNSEIDTTTFIANMQELGSALDAKNIPLVYVQMPYSALNEAEREFTNYDLYIEAAEEIIASLPQNADVLDLNKVLSDELIKNFYLSTDIHPKTYSEFVAAKEMCDFLAEKHDLDFTNTEQVFDIKNYTCSLYPFLGNTTRNTGKIFTPVEQFDMYYPDFETSMDLYVYETGKKKEGSFTDVCMNGYQNREDTDEYTYWITNYLQYPYAHYEINNHLCDGPSILFITDSYFLSSMAYTSLAASHVTVVDPRTLDDVYLVNNLLNSKEYDAVIVGGSSSVFLNAEFKSTVTIPDKVEGFQNRSHGGMFLYVNGNKPEVQRVVTTDMFGEGNTIKLNGWAVDFAVGKPLAAMYLNIGERMLSCSYGSEFASVAKAFDNDALVNTGFEIDIPLEYLTDVEYLDFTLIGHDGSYRFENVRYYLIDKKADNPTYSANELALPDEIDQKQDGGYYGMWLDTVNSIKPEQAGKISRTLFDNAETVTLSGWAVDLPAGMPLSALYVKAGDKLIKCDYGIQMVGVTSAFKNEKLLNSGYMVTFPSKYLDGTDKLEFIQIGYDGSYRYANVQYKLVS